MASSSGTDEARPDHERTKPTLVEPPTPAQVLARAVSSWRGELAAQAGASSLADISLLGDALLDLSAAHPSGVAQLFAGRRTQLANLFREGSSLPNARRRARAVGIRAKEHAERYGIAPTYLAIGVATWTEDAPSGLADSDVAALARVAGGTGAALNAESDAGPVSELPDPPGRAQRKVRAPVLLRPIRVQPRGSGESDYDLTLEPSAELNPVLSRALRSRGALLDPVALAQGTFANGGFDPRAATERVHALGSAVLADFELVEKLIVGTFVHPGQLLVDDLDELSGLEHHELLVAIAQTVQDPQGTTPSTDPLPARTLGDQDPGEDRGVGDLDSAQRHLLEVANSGVDLFVDAPAGADVAGTVAAVLADSAARGRNVLYVPGHRRAAEGVIGRMEDLGLADLLLDVPPEPTWRARVAERLLSALTLEAPVVDRAALGKLRSDLKDTRRRLAGYIDSLHLVREPWGVSAYDALQGLARLTSERPAPAGKVRLDYTVTSGIDLAAREELGSELARVAELGAFTLRATATPWFGAELTTGSAAQDAHAAATKLATKLPALNAQVVQVRNASGLTEPQTLRAWGQQLTMLAGMRTTLDVFQPIIFERTAADLVAATATRQWRAENGMEMGFLHRRRLRRQAKDMLRPGTRVPDLHTALIEVQAQREIWQENCPGGGWPRLPEGLADIERTFADVRTEVDALESVLVTTPAGGGLMDASLPDLLDRAERLAADKDALDTLPDRHVMLASLRKQGLGALLDDLANRRVPTERVRSELDLAWWSSVFEQILATDRALAVYDGAGLEELAGRFRDLDREHIRELSGPVLADSIGHLTRTIRNYPQAAESLFSELIEGRFASLRETFEKFPILARTLRPAIMATPTLVPHILPATRTVDLVILDSVQHLPLEVLISSIARGRQVLVIGDARCASGDAVSTLNRVLPSLALRAQVSSRDQQFVDFLVRHGYEGVLRPTPLPEARALIGFEMVDGRGVPDPTSAMVMTTPEEVERVVDLAITHALSHPEESLAIVALSEIHADRIREALLSEVRHNPALANYFDPAKPEAVVIADLLGVAGLSRDAVILSLGFGRTPHGRVLHRFGRVSELNGREMLLDVLGVSRARLQVVTTFGYGDLDPERLRSPGAGLLGDLLEFAERRALEGPASMLNDGVATDLNPDRLVIDLAERLWGAGLLVETDFGLQGGDRIPLVVGHPDFPDRMLVAVLTDDDAYVAESSVRVRDRQIRERLEVLGWTVVQVWSAAAFLDPVKEANRVRSVVLDLAAELAKDPAVSTPPPPALADAGDVTAMWTDQDGDSHGGGGDAPTGADDGSAEADPVPTRTERPNVQTGLPINAYGDNQIDALAQWINSDGIERDAEQLSRALRSELGVVRRSNRVNAVINSAVARVLAP